MTLNVFETVMILSTKDEEVITKAEIKKFKNLIQSFTPLKEVKLEDLGEKKLVYEIKGNSTGYYCVFTWVGVPDSVSELERQMRIDDHILKFMTLKTDFEPDEIADRDPAISQSEQDVPEEKPDALDVLLGLATYKRKEEN